MYRRRGPTRVPRLAALLCMMSAAGLASVAVEPTREACAAAQPGAEGPACVDGGAAAGEPPAADHVLLQTRALPKRSAPEPSKEQPAAEQESEPSTIRTEAYWFQPLVLARHNAYRCLHGAPPLTWDVRIEQHAKEWALIGRRNKSPEHYLRGLADIGYPLLGELVADGVENKTGPGSPDAVVDKWYGEMPLPTGAVAEYSYDTAQYTQLVWKSTTSLGCGLFAGFMVCQYGPAGNIDGHFATEVPPLLDPAPAECGTAEQEGAPLAAGKRDGDGGGEMAASA